ncbi:MAG: hypothetical protein RRY95_07210 [Oscillospiraceae bacterium]
MKKGKLWMLVAGMLLAFGTLGYGQLVAPLPETLALILNGAALLLMAAYVGDLFFSRRK